MFFILINMLLANMVLVPGTRDIYKKDVPPTIAVAESQELANQYAKNLNGALGPLDGGCLVQIHNYRVFVANCVEFEDVRERAEKLIRIYQQYFPLGPVVAPAPIRQPAAAAVPSRHQDPVPPQSKSRFSGGSQTLSWPEMAAGTQPTERVRIGREDIPIVTEAAMAALVKQQLGLTGHVTCKRRINGDGAQSSETVAIYTIIVDGTNRYVVKQFPPNREWFNRKVQFFENAFDRLGDRALEPITLDRDFDLKAQLILPIDLCNVGETYLEILPMAAGKCVEDLLKDLRFPKDDRFCRSIWALLGKSLGGFHAKFGQYIGDPITWRVPQMDFQTRNVFYADWCSLMSMIDLDNLGKDPCVGLAQIIEQEVLLIAKNKTKTADGTFVESDIRTEFLRVYINGYVSMFPESLQSLIRAEIGKIKGRKVLSEEDRRVQQQVAADAALARQLRQQDQDAAALLRQLFQEGPAAAVGAASMQAGPAPSYEDQLAEACAASFAEDSEKKSGSRQLTKDDEAYMLRRKATSGIDLMDQDYNVAAVLIANDKTLSQGLSQDEPTAVCIAAARALLDDRLGLGRGKPLLAALFQV